MAIDKVKINESLTYTGSWQGGRCKDIKGEDGVIAAAICISLLNELKAVARAKPLTTQDLQIVLDALVMGADMVEVQNRPGGNTLERKKHPKPTKAVEATHAS